MTAIYRPTEAIQHLRPTLLLPRIQPRPSHRTNVARAALFCTTNSPRAVQSDIPPKAPSRRNITLTGDTGQVHWSNLSPAEKAIRTTQQSWNLVVVVVGITATLGVGYVLFSDVFSPSSKTAFFNRAVTMVRSSPQCQSLLGPSDQIAAHGEASWSRHARNRFLQHTEHTDKWGTEHMQFRFFVEGPKGEGVVHVHLTKRPSQSEYEFAELGVDVKGHARVDLVQGDKTGKVAPKIFGARWW